jgi:hypothetical protein
MHDIEDIKKFNDNPAAYRAGRDAATSVRLQRVPPGSPIVTGWPVPLHVFWRGTNYVSGVDAPSVQKVHRTTIKLPYDSEVLNFPKKYPTGLARAAEIEEFGQRMYEHVVVLFCIEGGIIHAVTPCTENDLQSLASRDVE